MPGRNLSQPLCALTVPATDVTALQPETALDELETTIQATGNVILKRVLQAQSDTIDATLVEQHRQRFSPRRRPRRRS